MTFNLLEKRARSGQRGLTLLELLVVLSILAVLSTVALTSSSGLADQARYEATQRTLENIREAVLGPGGHERVLSRASSGGAGLGRGARGATGHLGAVAQFAADLFSVVHLALQRVELHPGHPPPSPRPCVPLLATTQAALSPIANPARANPTKAAACARCRA